MSRVAIVTDSVTCLPKELVKKYGICVVPVHVIIDGKSYRDGVDITPTELYSRLNQLKTLPTTSAPSPGEFLDTFKEQSKTTREILCVTLSSKLSATYDAAHQAMEMAKDSLPDTTISILDSLTAAGAEGFVAIAAARAADEGKNLAAVTKAAEHIITRVNMLGLLDTLHYLAKGGRIHRTAAWMGAIFRIKPILHIKPAGGKVSLLEKARTRRRGIDRLIAIMKELVDSKQLHLNIQHANALEEAEKLRKRVIEEFNCAETYITDFTPVMGASTGPGVLALSFYCDD